MGSAWGSRGGVEGDAGVLGVLAVVGIGAPSGAWEGLDMAGVYGRAV